MSKYIKLFDNHQNYDDFTKTSDFLRPNVSHCIVDSHVHYNPCTYADAYLTFEVVEGGTITIKATDTSIAKKIFYKVNDGEWVSLTTTTTQQDLGGELNVGDKVFVKGNNATYGTVSFYNSFGGTAKVNVYGNIMSLISGDKFVGSDTLSEIYTFHGLFYGYTNLLSAEKLILFAKTLASNCYYNMFHGCTSLVNAPELPSTTLANGCYQNMFDTCTSLKTAPQLPAITLANECYLSMFSNCSKLTTAPELPAKTMKYRCYYYMFSGCTILKTAPELPAETLVNQCYEGMFTVCTKLNYIKAMFTTTPSASYTKNWVNRVASRGRFVKNSAATWNVTGVHGIPTGWTVETASA